MRFHFLALLAAGIHAAQETSSPEPFTEEQCLHFQQRILDRCNKKIFPLFEKNRRKGGDSSLGRIAPNVRKLIKEEVTKNINDDYTSLGLKIFKIDKNNGSGWETSGNVFAEKRYRDYKNEGLAGNIGWELKEVVRRYLNKRMFFGKNVTKYAIFTLGKGHVKLLTHSGKMHVFNNRAAAIDDDIEDEIAELVEHGAQKTQMREPTPEELAAMQARELVMLQKYAEESAEEEIKILALEAVLMHLRKKAIRKRNTHKGNKKAWKERGMNAPGKPTNRRRLAEERPIHRLLREIERASAQI